MIGHRDWAQTFHRIPKLVDSTMEKLGGSRIAPLGLTDAAQGDMFTDFETWEDELFWPAMAEKYGVTQAGAEGESAPSLSVEMSTPRTSTLRQDVREAVVVDVRDLCAPGAPPKRHLEIKLPSNMTYRSGDYLAVLPINPNQNVLRAMRRFQIPWDTYMTIKADGHTNLPTNVSLPVSDVLGAYVELGQPATKRVSHPSYSLSSHHRLPVIFSLAAVILTLIFQGILHLVEATKDEKTKEELQKLAGDDYLCEISVKKVSILRLLEKFPSIDPPFGTFLSLLPPMRVRQ